MSNSSVSSRLLSAADRLDNWHAAFHGTTHLPGFVLANWTLQAALLRAVAAEAVCRCTQRGLADPGCPSCDVMLDSLSAALDLADAVLGMNAEEQPAQEDPAVVPHVLTPRGEPIDLPVSLDDLMTAQERADTTAALERIARTRREAEVKAGNMPVSQHLPGTIGEVEDA